MQQTYFDIFSDTTKAMRVNINPYVSLLAKNAETSTLPVLHGPLLKGKKGRWHEHFQNQTPRKKILEIGSYMGQTINFLAENHPDMDFIGMDITFKRVVRTAERLREKNLTNAWVMLANANFLDHFFDENELDAVIIFFPDPWTKKKSQTKHQLFKEEFCSQLQRALKPGGLLWVKTDQESYFSKMKSLLERERFSEQKGASELYLTRHMTPFETLYTRQNLATFEKVWSLDK